MPAPVRGSSIADLRPLINVRTESEFVLVCAFILGSLNPNGPFMILLVNGEAGSAKSTLCRIVRALVDPNKAPLRSEPKDNRDLAITANNSWMIGLDNMSRISERLSNALCRLATGGGFATRELYTDADEAIFDALQGRGRGAGLPGQTRAQRGTRAVRRTHTCRGRCRRALRSAVQEPPRRL